MMNPPHHHASVLWRHILHAASVPNRYQLTERTQMEKKEKPRELTMLRHFGRKGIPTVTLGGLWLQNYGFSSGDKVKVEYVEDGKLTITKISSAE